MFSACLRLGLHKLAFAVASLCVDPAVVRSHAVWVYTDTSALETYEHTSYTVPHIVNRSMWMGRHQERHTAIFVPLGEETGLASCPVWWGKVYYVAWIISLLLPRKHILLSDHDAAPTALFEVADLQQLCVTESDFRLAAGEFPSDTIWDFAPAATRTPTPRHAVSVGTIFMSEPSTDAQGGLTVFCRIPGVAHTDFGVVPWMWRSEPAKLRNYVEACTKWPPSPHSWPPQSPWISGPFLHCWAAEVVAFALAKLQALAYLPRATCPDRRAGELLVGTPLCGAVASNSREVATAWAYLGLVLQEPYWGEAAENDCFHPGIRLPKPSAALRAALGTAGDSLGWARGAHEQCVNSALFALSQPSCLVCCLPGPGLMMSKTLPRDAGVIGPAFVHGYGSTGKARLQELDSLRAIPTIVESVWGWQRRPPSWATDKHGLLGAPGFHVYAPRSFQGLPCLSAQQRSWMVLRLRALGSQWAMGLATLPPGFLPSAQNC